jgi:hypothetical protein
VQHTLRIVCVLFSVSTVVIPRLRNITTNNNECGLGSGDFVCIAIFYFTAVGARLFMLSFVNEFE